MATALIPARRGSKGISRKNIAHVCGKPLICHSIEQAIMSAQISRVIVTSDDEDVLLLAKQYGVDAVLRPRHLATDIARTETALMHAIDFFQDTGQVIEDPLVLLQPTSPLRNPTDIDEAIEVYCATGSDSLFSACFQEGFIWEESRGENPRPLSYDHLDRPMRQNRKGTMAENGSIYVFSSHLLRTTGCRLGGEISVYLMDPLSSFQVDSIQDIERIESIAKVFPYSTPSIGEVAIIVSDFDGVLTDNRVYLAENGLESIICNRLDSSGADSLKKSGVKVIILSGESNQVVGLRCKKIGLEHFTGIANKSKVLKMISDSNGVPLREIMYIGNDSNDIECMKLCGHPTAVSDATPEAKRVARYFTQRKGGEGVLREVALWKSASGRGPLC